MLDYKFHHLSSRFTAGEKTQDGKMENAKAKARKSTESEGQKRHRHANGKPHARKNGRDGK
jgi:hypothetical protein